MVYHCLLDYGHDRGQTGIIMEVLSGSARTQDPTNKNYAPELSTFGIIIEVNRSEVQWNSLSLEKLPWWSRLISAPGKYEVPVRGFRLSTLCTNGGGSRSGGFRITLHVLPSWVSKNHCETKKVYYRQFVDSLFQPVQTLFWSETCIFGENNKKAEHFALTYQASYKYQAERPAASALRRGDTVINDRIERCCYC